MYSPSNILRNLLVLTPKGWVFAEEVNEGDKIYTVTPERTVKTVKVGDSFKEGMTFHYTGNNGLFEGYGSTNTEIYTLDGHTVAHGDKQTEGLETVSRSLGFLYHNPTFRSVLPIGFKVIFEPSHIPVTEYGTIVTDMVFKKHTGLNAQRLHPIYAGLYLKTWNLMHGCLLVDDDQMAMDIQHICFRAGTLSYVEKNSKGKLIVKPYDATITVESITLMNEKEKMPCFKGENGETLHCVFRTPTQKMFIA